VFILAFSLLIVLKKYCTILLNSISLAPGVLVEQQPARPPEATGEGPYKYM
jgi:hypothetical protein